MTLVAICTNPDCEREIPVESLEYAVFTVTCEYCGTETECQRGDWIDA